MRPWLATLGERTQTASDNAAPKPGIGPGSPSPAQAQEATSTSLSTPQCTNANHHFSNEAGTEPVERHLAGAWAAAPQTSTKGSTNGLFVSGRKTSVFGQCEMRYGSLVETDIRLAKLLQRETFFLTVVLPTHRSLYSAAQDWCSRSMRPSVYMTMLTVVLLHLGMAAYCGQLPDDPEEHGICAGGPVDELQQPLAYLSFGGDYGPPILNSLAVLMLSFYANTCLGLYRDAYNSCQNLKTSIVDLMTMVVGTIHPFDDDGIESRHKIRLEFWRVVNLLHVASYVLADKSRNTYNFDNFLIPVAAAFGEYDGKERLGMLRRAELLALGVNEYGEDELPEHLGFSAGEQRKNSLRAVGEVARKGSTAALRRAQQVAHSIQSHSIENARNRARTSAVDSVAAVRMATKPSFANSRGDVQSKTAALHAALGVRLYVRNLRNTCSRPLYTTSTLSHRMLCTLSIGRSS